MTTAADEPRRYRYADLLDLPEGAGYEIIDGELIVNPSPLTRHQRILSRLNRLLLDQLERRGEVLFAPLDVVFADDNVVQPDLLFVSRARASIVGDKNVQGAPDLVVEILSDGTRRKDLTRKKSLYARFGVPLYVVVDPDADRIELHRLDGAAYAPPVIVDAPALLEIAELGVRIETAALFA